MVLASFVLEMGSFYGACAFCLIDGRFLWCPRLLFHSFLCLPPPFVLEMGVEMAERLPFSVDTWTYFSLSKNRYHFLTHSHKDHTRGIAAHASYPVYCTSVTKQIVHHRYPTVGANLFLRCFLWLIYIGLWNLYCLTYIVFLCLIARREYICLIGNRRVATNWCCR